MKEFSLVCAVLLIVAFTSGAAAESGTDARDQTLSPYFFIAGDEPGVEQFPLENTAVEVAVSGVVAEVTVRQHYVNRGRTVINGRYIFPGSTRAAVHGMKMTIGERVVSARIKEKEEARTTFDTARRAGKSAALLEQQRPNVFSMDVANILPGDGVDIELRYRELLVPAEGTYEFVYPTVVGPRYSKEPAAGSPRGERWLQNPYLKTGEAAPTAFSITVKLATGLPLKEIVCPSHETAIAYDGESRARISLAVPAVFSGDRDYILRYRLAGEQIASGLLLQSGEKENFFLLMAQPPERVRPELLPAREYIFVVDVSGSMHGFPLDTAKELLQDLIGGLQPTDTFNVLLFAGGSDLMAPASVPAIPAEIDRAVKLINDSSGGGGTELLAAMRRAMALPSAPGVSRTMILVTDGYIGAERGVFAAIEENLGHTNVFAFGIGSSVNRYLIEGIARAGRGEPFVVTGPDTAGAAARTFRRYVSQPVLTDLSLSFAGFEVYDVEPPALPDLFAERPVLVFGKWRGEPRGTIELSGTNGAGGYHRSFAVAEADLEETEGGLGFLWARERLARLSDFESGNGDKERRAEIVSLGLTYNLLTAFTSFVAVDETVRNPQGAARDVTQPLPLPHGVSELAVGGGMHRTPEPGLAVLLLLLSALGLLRLRRRSVAARTPDRGRR